MKKLLSVLLACGIWLLCFNSPAEAYIVRLDNDFGGSGFVTFTEETHLYMRGAETASQPDGKMLVTGHIVSSGNSYMFLIRYTVNGTLDSSFNSTGYYISPVYSSGHDVVYLPDSKILVVGEYNENMAIWRFLDDGSLDSSFGGDGLVEYDNGDLESGWDVVIDSSGRYVISGFTGLLSTAILWRYNPDGIIDTSFNGGTGYNEFYSVSPIGDYVVSHAVEELSDGKLIAVQRETFGMSGTDYLWRFNQDGTVDYSYNGGSPVFVTNNAKISNPKDCLEVQSDDKVLVVNIEAVGSTDSDGYIRRYNTDGTPDTSFGGSGNVVLVNTASSSREGASSVILDHSDNIIVAGYTNLGSYPQVAVWRLDQSGNYDSEFFGSGFWTYDHGIYEWGYGLSQDYRGGYVVSVGDTHLTTYRVENLYQIDNLSAGLDVEDESLNIEVGSGEGSFGYRDLLLRSSGTVIAEIPTMMFQDNDWINIRAETDTVNFRSFAHNVSSSPGVSGPFTLFIPRRSGDEAVGVCPLAESIDEVSRNCENVYFLPLSDERVSSVDIEGSEYFRVEGLEGTGAFSIANLPQTGQPIWILIWSGALLILPVIKKNLNQFLS